MTDFELRAGTDQDLPLVYSATAKSLRSSPLYRDITRDQYSEVMNGLVTRMTAQPWELTIAHPTGFPREVAGFVMARHGEKHAIGFVYVKEPYRRQGVGRALLDAATGGETDFLAVLAQPKVLGWCRDAGLRPQLSPYYL